MPIPSVTGFSNLVHHHLPNTAFAIVEEVYQRLPELMNLRDMLYALDKNPDFFTNAFKSTDYYGISFNGEYLDTLGYNPRSIKDMQILATHIMGDSSYTRFYYKDTVEFPNQDGTVNYLVFTFLLPKIRDISKFKIYSKDRSISREITVDSHNVFVVDAENVLGLDLNTEQTFAEILPAVNSTVTTGGSGESSTPVELPENLVTYDSDNNVLKSGETTIQISADVPENIITTDNIGQYTSNFLTSSDLPDTSSFLTSSDLPDLSGYVETSDVANEAGKIPRFNNQGHLVLPDGTEIWCENE